MYPQQMVGSRFMGFMPTDNLYFGLGTAASWSGMGFQQAQNQPYFSNRSTDPRLSMSCEQTQVQGDLLPATFNPDAIPPFEDATLKFGPTSYGVIRVKNVSNIPFTFTAYPFV